MELEGRLRLYNIIAIRDTNSILAMIKFQLHMAALYPRSHVGELAWEQGYG